MTRDDHANSRSIPNVRDAHLRIVRAAGLDRLLRPLHRWVWSDARRRGEKLLKFAQTEADGGRDIARASPSARATRSLAPPLFAPRHGRATPRQPLFRTRGRAILEVTRMPKTKPASFDANWFSPGERGLDDLNVARPRIGKLAAGVFASCQKKRRPGDLRFIKRCSPSRPHHARRLHRRPQRRGFSHELHPRPIETRRAEKARRAFVVGASHPTLERLFADRQRQSPTSWAAWFWQYNTF